LLILLEQDESNISFCPRYTKLHKWHTRGNRSIPPYDIEDKMPCKTTNEDTLHLPYLIFIRYYHARLVMNRHLYGPTHCVSINKFNKRARTVEDAFRVTITVSHHSCIVDDKLLVSSTMLMSHPRGDAASFRRSVDERPRPVCAHIGMRKPYSPGLAPVQLPELEASSIQ
jgi:hypothetical protein